MKRTITIAIALAMAGLIFATVASAGHARYPTRRHAFRLIADCAHNAGAGTIKRTRGGGEMIFGGAVQPGLTGVFQTMLGVVPAASALSWGYVSNEYGRVWGLMVETSGTVPRRVLACLQRSFGHADQLS